MIRKKRKFSWPRKLYDKKRIEEENFLIKKYGLKNKREIWKAEARIRYLRNRAKNLITAEEKNKETFFIKLREIGLKVNNIADVLALTKEDILKRYLTSIIISKKIADSPLQARQMITHKRICIGNDVVSSPSYVVRVDEEKLISLHKNKIKHSIKNKIKNENGEEI